MYGSNHSLLTATALPATSASAYVLASHTSQWIAGVLLGLQITGIIVVAWYLLRYFINRKK